MEIIVRINNKNPNMVIFKYNNQLCYSEINDNTISSNIFVCDSPDIDITNNDFLLIYFNKDSLHSDIINKFTMKKSVEEAIELGIFKLLIEESLIESKSFNENKVFEKMKDSTYIIHQSSSVN